MRRVPRRDSARSGRDLVGLPIPATGRAHRTALAVFYLLGLGPLTNALLETPLAVRVLVTFLLLAPLGICLGTFMPIGLRIVSGLTEHPTEYSAWGWAVNGFASVVGSVLTTLLAMTFGFQVVLILGLAMYLLALLALRWLLRAPSTGAAAR